MLNGLHQGFSGGLDVAAQKMAGGVSFALAAKIKQRMMFSTDLFKATSQIKMQTRVAVAVVVEPLNDGHEARAIGARVERGMKLVVQPAPRADFAFRPERFVKDFENLFGFLEILFL